MKSGDKVIVTKLIHPHITSMIGLELTLHSVTNYNAKYWNTLEHWTVNEEGLSLPESSNVRNILSHYPE